MRVARVFSAGGTFHAQIGTGTEHTFPSLADAMAYLYTPPIPCPIPQHQSATQSAPSVSLSTSA